MKRSGRLLTRFEYDPMQATLAQVARFAEFEVDLRAGELRRQGTKVRLQEQPFRLLAALLESAGEVVTREELRQRLWHADTFVDFDHRLAAAVSKVRDALRDSAEDPKFIETLGRRGYRFMQRVDFVAAPGSEAPSASAAEEPGRVEKKPAVRRGIFVAGAIAGSVVLTVVLLRYGREIIGMASGPRISSIAVLPLENLSNDPEQEYFVEGMTDEIITDLAKLPGVRVISRTSTQQYKGTRKTMPQIARELKVDAVVEGTVLRVGERVRVRAQLIYAPADRHIWAEAYERDLKDVLALQASLSEDIAKEIQLKLTSSEQANLKAGRAVDAETHELYLKGRFFWNKRDPEGFAKAVDYFQQAIVKDSSYAQAYAGLADAYALSGGMNLIPAAEAMPRAKAAAEKALELDGNLAEAHASLGLIAPFIDWDWTSAKYHYERAIELNPNYATGHHWYAEGYLLPIGEVDKAIAETRKAQELDPLSAAITTDLGKELFFARRYNEALVQFGRALEIDASFTSAHNWISDSLLEKGDYPGAIAELEKTKAAREERVYIRQTAYLHARMGQRAQAQAELARALQLSQGKPVSSGAVALTYAAVGDKEQAFAWLEKAYAEQSSFMTSLKYWTVFDSLRTDPRYNDLLSRVGLPPGSN